MEAKSNPSPEILQPLNQKDVWGEFGNFQQAAQRGFMTEEQRLGAYGRLISTLARFFDQPEITQDSNAKEAFELVNKMFYHHQEVAPVQMDFFLGAKKRIFKEVLDQGYVRPGLNRWKDEVLFLRDYSRLELGEVSRRYNEEQRASITLHQLASGQQETSAQGQPDSIEQRQLVIQEVAVKHLSDDPELKQDIRTRNNLVTTLENLANQSDFNPDIMRDLVQKYEDYLPKTNSDLSLGDELYLWSSSGNSAQVKKIIERIIRQVDGNSYLWRRWSEKGLIPPELVESFEEIIALADLKDVADANRGKSEAENSAAVLPFIQRGISATLLLELAQGRFELKDDFIEQQVESFIHFNDQYKKVKGRSLSTKQKLLRGALVALVLGSTLLSSGQRPKEIELRNPEFRGLPAELYQSDQEEITLDEILSKFDQASAKEIEKMLGIDVGSIDLSKSSGSEIVIDNAVNLGNVPDQGISSQDPETIHEILQGPSQAKTEILPTGDQLSKPKNSSLEEFKEAQKQELWSLQGKDLRGFYRTATASKFDIDQKGWLIKRQYKPNGKISLTESKDITLTDTIMVGRRMVELPARPYYLVTKGQTRLTNIDIQPDIFQTADGNYFLLFRPEHVGKEVTITYSLGSVNKDTIPFPGSVVLDEMYNRLITWDSLPSETDDFMERIYQRKDLSQHVKAKLIEKYIKETFSYSLDPTWSDYYREASNTPDFLKRILEVRKADCDVANTVLIALLRLHNIPARMAFGYAHNNPQINPDEKTFTAAEAHGWVEAWIDNHWVMLDATPSKPDLLTDKGLEENLSPEELENLRQQEELAKQIEQTKSWAKDNPEVSGGAFLELLNLAALSGSILLRRRNNKKARRLQFELDERLKAYFGADYEDVRSKIVAEEKWKIRAGRTYGTSKLAVIPPGGYLNLAGDIWRTLVSGKLFYRSKFPYQERKTDIIPVATPSVYEAYSKILGFDETEIKLKLYEEHYEKAESQVSEAFRRRGDQLFGDNILTYSAVQQLRNGISERELHIGEGDENGIQRREAALNKLYQYYLKERAKGESKIKKETGDESRANIPEIMTREQFVANIDELLRYRMVLNQMWNSYYAAVLELKAKKPSST